MQIIHDSKAVFKITINPFLKTIEIYHYKYMETYVWEYTDLDEWMGYHFGLEKEIYDFHLLYDDGGLEFSIYEVKSGKPMYEDSIPYDLHIDWGK